MIVEAAETNAGRYRPFFLSTRCQTQPMASDGNNAHSDALTAASKTPQESLPG